MEKRGWRKGLVLCLIAVMLTLIVVPVYADQLADKQKELQEIQQRMEEQKRILESTRQQYNTIADQLQSIQQELDAAQADLNAINAKLVATQEQVASTQEQINVAEQNLAARTKILNNRVKDIYESGNINYLDVLFTAKDFTDFVNRFELLKSVVASDIALFNQIKEERAQLVAKKNALEESKKQILSLQNDLLAKRQEIESRRNAQQVILNSIEQERDAAEQAYQEEMQKSREIEAFIRSHQSGSKGGGQSFNGSMVWPTDGPITSPFGWRVHPIFGTSLFHSGIDIGADYGQPIVAAAGGTVIYADWMGGYGKTVIIDHGNGISTLYGHTSEIAVSVGQTVSQGETIAYVGSTGFSTGPHLHFEVRENGSPVDPLGYLP